MLSSLEGYKRPSFRSSLVNVHRAKWPFRADTNYAKLRGILQSRSFAFPSRQHRTILKIEEFSRVYARRSSGKPARKIRFLHFARNKKIYAAQPNGSFRNVQRRNGKWEKSAHGRERALLQLSWQTSSNTMQFEKSRRLQRFSSFSTTRRRYMISAVFHRSCFRTTNRFIETNHPARAPIDPESEISVISEYSVWNYHVNVHL